MTSQETMAHAQDIIAKDVMRRNELRPFGDVSGLFGSSPGDQPTSSPPRRHLSFSADGTAQASGPDFPTKPIRGLTPSKKRREEELGGSDTEVEDDEDDVQTNHARGIDTTQSMDDFPPVFTSPQISQPELFAGGGPSGLPQRLVRGMPGRNLGKTVSAPVGRLGAWADSSQSMEVEEDGFDVSEWAASEQF